MKPILRILGLLLAVEGALMLLCGSLGFWLYLICWIILPVENQMLNE